MIGSSTKMRYIFKPQTNHHPFFNVKMLSKDSKGINVGGFFEICVILTMTAFRRTSISFRICLSVWDTWFSCFIGSPCNVKKCPNHCQFKAHKCWQLLRWSYAVTLVSGLDVMDETPMTNMPVTFVLGVGVLGLGIIFGIGVFDDDRWVTSTRWCFKMLLVTH